MRRALVSCGAAIAVSACSLVYGIHDNVGPIDAGPDVAADVAPEASQEASAPANGCPSDAGSGHTYCEFFDESPPWPANAMMLAGPNAAPTLESDACVSPPSCIFAANANGYVQRQTLTPNGVDEIKVDLYVRSDANIQTSKPPRGVWVDVAHGTTTTFGMTFSVDGSVNDAYLFWAGDVTAGSTAAVTTITYKSWYHFLLDVQITGKLASLTNLSGSGTRTEAFDEIPLSIPSASVTSVTVYAGQGTAIAGMSGAADSVVVDITP